MYHVGYWNGKKVAVLGGASPIGSRCVEMLLVRNVKDVWVADNFSTGYLRYVPRDVKYLDKDLREWRQATDAIRGADVVFNFACLHGGRGFVSSHDVDCYDNVTLDAKIFRVCAEQRVEQVLYASSACVYDVSKQQNPDEILYIPESWQTFTTPLNSDGAYGIAKAIGERVLDAYVRAGAYKGVSCRFFTVMSERMNLTHAIGAMIARCMIKQDPYQIWGYPNVIRNWTYVDDTVRGMLLAAENMESGAVNIGSEDRITMEEAVETVYEVIGWTPNEFEYLTDKPIGIKNRVADATKAHELLDWYPEYNFKDGIKKVVNAFAQRFTKDELRNNFEWRLTEIK